jgi:hypothetical protein
MGRGISLLTRDRLDAAFAYAKTNRPVTVRGVAYHLFTRIPPLIESMAEKHVAEVSRILVRAREEGDLPWEWIVDEGRGVEGGHGWDSLEQFGEAMLDHYRKNRWLDQDFHVELWSEKATVKGLLAPVIRRYQIPFRVMKGFVSASEAKEISNQIESVAAEGKEFVALYIGDWDPSGLCMSERDLPERLERYGDGSEFTIRRIALIEEDLAGLPSFPLETKKGDPRYNWYRKNHHPSVCWEIDAMSPVALRARVEAEIKSHIDADLWRRADEVERAERDSIREFVGNLKTL